MMTEPTRELTPEERKRGERLLRRADALITAYWVVEEDFMPNAEVKAETLKHLKEMREDPRTIAAVRQGQRERAAREAQAEERRQQEEEARRANARAELEQERQRRLNFWLSHGGNEESFAKAWPDMERKILEEKQAALDRKRAEGSIF